MKESDFNRAVEQSALYAILGNDGVAELKSRVINLIVDDIKDGLESGYEYIVEPEEITNAIMNDIKSEVVNELKEEYKNKIRKIMQKKFEAAFGEDEYDG